MAAVARLELRIDPEQKRLIGEAAAAEHQSVSAVVVDALVRRARAVVGGREGHAPRTIGGSSFALPEGWDAPLGHGPGPSQVTPHGLRTLLDLSELKRLDLPVFPSVSPDDIQDIRGRLPSGCQVFWAGDA